MVRYDLKQYRMSRLSLRRKMLSSRAGENGYDLVKLNFGIIRDQSRISKLGHFLSDAVLFA